VSYLELINESMLKTSKRVDKKKDAYIVSFFTLIFLVMRKTWHKLSLRKHLER